MVSDSMSFAVVPSTRGAFKSFAMCDTTLTPVPAAARNARGVWVLVGSVPGCNRLACS